MPSRRVEAHAFLPLTPLAFQVLLALADAARHGYAIIQEIEAHTGGHVRLRTGTLYTVLQRLEHEALIVESDRRPANPVEDDARRRYYALTPLGRAVLEAEAARLDLLVLAARRKRVLGRSSKA